MDVSKIRENLLSGHFVLSRHALKRIVERNVSIQEIHEVGGNVEIIEEYPDDKYSPSCLVLGFTSQGRSLHLQICYVEMNLLKVITIYEPDEKIWIDYRKRK